MSADIVFPHNNEKEFMIMAEKFGYTSLYLTYPYLDLASAKVVRSQVSFLKSNLMIHVVFLARPQDFPEVRKTGCLCLVEAGDNPRATFDALKPDIIFNI